MQSRRLILVRHAKAEPGGRDVDRPLALRGEADAAAVGGWLNEQAFAPDLAVVSPSRRTIQTWEIASARFARAVPHVLDERIYDNRVGLLLDLVRETAPSVTALALVGHNPSTHELAIRLGGDEVGQEFPTACVAVLDVSGEWSDLSHSSAQLKSVTVCRA